MGGRGALRIEGLKDGRNSALNIAKKNKKHRRHRLFSAAAALVPTSKHYTTHHTWRWGMLASTILSEGGACRGEGEGGGEEGAVGGVAAGGGVCVFRHFFSPSAARALAPKAKMERMESMEPITAHYTTSYPEIQPDSGFQSRETTDSLDKTSAPAYDEELVHKVGPRMNTCSFVSCISTILDN